MKKLNTYISNEKISSLDEYIIEKLKFGKSFKIKYTCQPKDRYELREILEKRLAKDKNANLNDIDVSKITDMGKDNNLVGLFEYLDPHNIDISQWDVSNVKDMSDMFHGCANLDCDISNWDVSGVENMRGMFIGCTNFNYDLSDWDVSNVKDMAFMFKWCENFNCDLDKWKVSNVETMYKMFYDCTSLKNKPSWYKE